MWVYAHPEELKHYKCRQSLKKLKEELNWWYHRFDENNWKREPKYMQKGTPVFWNNLWFTGVSSNPLLSLPAHRVDPKQSGKFFCMVIPVKYAKELKDEVLAMEQFQHCSDDASDYIAEEQPYTFLYSFLVEEDSVLSIAPSGFTPLKYIPGTPAQVFVWYTNGSRKSWRIETKDRDSYPEVLERLVQQARDGEIARLLLKCSDNTIMQCDVRESGGYDLLYDARTSQSGYVYRYLPEEGREEDWETLYDLLLYFLQFYKKRRGTKWKYVKKAMASDNMLFVNGMIRDFEDE